MYRLTSAAVTGLLIVATVGTQGVRAQSIISAHSGVVHYSEGRVLIGDAAIDPKPGQFVSLKPDKVLLTEEGRAEVLLTRGVFLGIGEAVSIRMVSNRLTDTRIEVLGGAAVAEVADMPRDNAVTLLYKDRTMSLRKNGIYRVDTEPARFAVYSGEAVVTAGSDQLTLKGGKETSLDGVLVASRFNTKEGGAGDDALYRWSKRRDGYDSMANVYAARSVLA